MQELFIGTSAMGKKKDPSTTPSVASKAGKDLGDPKTPEKEDRPPSLQPYARG